MPLILGSDKSISVRAYSIEVDRFTVAPNKKRAQVRYFFKDQQGVEVHANSLDITDSNFERIIEKVEFYVSEGHNAYGAIKRALYDAIKEAEGVSGDVE